ncbi:MAG: hypothetical protein ACO2PM_00670 [Pyrobaculum sp.]|jgi:hypothetical protein
MLHFEITNSGHRAVFIRCLRAPQEVCNRVYDAASSLWQSGVKKFKYTCISNTYD